MHRRKFILLLFICLISTAVCAQQTVVTGKVVDSETGSPMSYASVRIKEKALGVVANERGEFTLSLNSSPEAYTLVVSFVGYKTYETNLTQ